MAQDDEKWSRPPIRRPGRTMTALVLVLFIIGYALITLEHRYHLHKAITAAALGAVLWLIIALKEGEAVKEATEKTGAEIFALVFFLMAAMTLVEILVHYRFFDWIRTRLLGLGLNDYQQLWVIGGISFFLSAVIDNLTATLVMLAIAGRFFRGSNMLVAAATIVIAANAGGAWSPIGDVTTIMLWLAEKYGAADIIAWTFVPSVTLFLVSTWMLARGIRGDTHDLVEESVVLSGSEKVIIACSLGTFPLPLVFSQIGLEPYFGLIFGLGIVGMLISAFRLAAARSLGLSDLSEDALNHGAGESQKTHLTSDIEKKLSRIDIASLLFFAGILLSVGALDHLGVLDAISEQLLGDQPSLVRFVTGNTSLGALSAIVDNIPLTAAAIGILNTTDPAIWTLLALTVGTGGSMLVIGSAAGVVAMGRVKELTFFGYMRLATLPAAVGYLAAVAVWWLQYEIVR
jgi:Na+/H+ antiporter NhaD/arsenite permease-like protein